MWFGHKNNLSTLNVPMFKSGRSLIVLTKNYKCIVSSNNLYVLKLLVSKNATIKVSNIDVRVYVLNFSKKSLIVVFHAFKKLIVSIYSLFFKKIKFEGKGYYLFKNKKKVLGLQFNYSHKLNILLTNCFSNKFSKRSWIFFGLNWASVVQSSHNVTNFRDINIFTLKGIRFAKQVIFKKDCKN